jgi:hypothetical protein
VMTPCAPTNRAKIYLPFSDFARLLLQIGALRLRRRPEASKSAPRASHASRLSGAPAIPVRRCAAPRSPPWRRLGAGAPLLAQASLVPSRPAITRPAIAGPAIRRSTGPPGRCSPGPGRRGGGSRPGRLGGRSADVPDSDGISVPGSPGRPRRTRTRAQRPRPFVVGL